MAKMTAEEREVAAEFSEASQTFWRRGWNAYTMARMNGLSHEEGMAAGRAVEAEA